MHNKNRCISVSTFDTDVVNLSNSDKITNVSVKTGFACK